MAYWHYECANVTEQILDTEWGNKDFLCPLHQPSKVKSQEGIRPNNVEIVKNKRGPDVKGHNEIDGVEKDAIVTTLRVTPYNLNPSSSLKKLRKSLLRNLLIERKDSGKQYKVTLNTATFHLLVNNIMLVGEKMGLQIANNNVDQSGK